MNKTIRRLLIIILAIFFMFTAQYANQVGTNQSVSENFEIFHRVDRISFFKSQKVNDALDISGADTEFLKVFVRNNTYDGFNVYLTPANGVFKAQNTTVGTTDSGAKNDGEADIPYTISVVKTTGETGSGMVLGYNATSSGGKHTWTSETVQQGTTDQTALQVFHLSGSNQSSSTDAEVAVLIALDKAYTDVLGMSGRYSESIAISYTDL